MLSSTSTIVVDADALIALFDTTDANAQKAFSLAQSIAQAQATLLYPATAIAEAVTTFQRNLSNPLAAAQIITKITSKQLMIEPVDQTIIDESAVLFNPHGSKKNTLFDAVVAAVAKKHAARAVFSFDDWYHKVGLQLVSDIV